MAQKVNIVLIDDIDGSEAEETVTFGLDGSSYEIDLSTANAGRLRSALAEFVGSGRKVAGRRGRPSSRTSLGPDPREVRDWARGAGYDVSDRGRVPAEILQAFAAAH